MTDVVVSVVLVLVVMVLVVMVVRTSCDRAFSPCRRRALCCSVTVTALSIAMDIIIIAAFVTVATINSAAAATSTGA